MLNSFRWATYSLNAHIATQMESRFVTKNETRNSSSSTIDSQNALCIILSSLASTWTRLSLYDFMCNRLFNQARQWIEESQADDLLDV